MSELPFVEVQECPAVHYCVIAFTTRCVIAACFIPSRLEVASTPGFHLSTSSKRVLFNLLMVNKTK
jgi:hypothetical protein